MSRTPEEQLTHFLSDMYSVEQQALAQLVTAPEVARDERLAEDFRQHHEETKRQAELVGNRLDARGGSPSAIKDAIMKLGGKGFLLFARLQPETPGRLVVHAYSYEAMEWAGYEMLRRLAEVVGDAETAAVARAIGDEERTMMRRLEGGFDAAEETSHRDADPSDLDEHVRKHLADVHAFEKQQMQLLEKGESIAGSDELSSLYSQLGREFQRHGQSVETRLGELGAEVSRVKDAALSMGGVNWGLFFQAQSDTPAKLAAFVYAVIYLEIGAYELLKRTARRAGDSETQRLCEEILAEKLVMAERVHAHFDVAIDATLAAVA